jgi:hypothetical protein
MDSEFTPKFLATVSHAGNGNADPALMVPNVVPVLSLQAADPKTLIFGDFMIYKTKRNLVPGAKVCVGVLTEELQVYVIKGIFRSFENTGKLFNNVNSKPMFRYNAYTGVRNVGIIDVSEVVFETAVKTVHVLKAHVGGIIMGSTSPAKPFLKEFTRLKSARFFAWVDAQGWPHTVPVFGVRFSDRLTMRLDLSPLGQIPLTVPQNGLGALAIITFDPVAYQVKGSFIGRRRSQIDLELSHLYNASPPLPGKEIPL